MQNKVVEVNSHEIDTPYSFFFVFQYIGIILFITFFIFLLYHYYHTKEIFFLSEFINFFSTENEKSSTENKESITENKESITENEKSITENKESITENKSINQMIEKMIYKQNDSKPQYCFVGDYNGKRSCVEIHNESCLSGDIFPSEEKCINPNLRYD